MLTPGNMSKFTTGHLRDSMQIWVGSEGSDSVASFHYTFVEKQPLKRKHGHYILSVDDVVTLGDVEDGIPIKSIYTIRLRPHLAPTGTLETAHPLPELVLAPLKKSEPPRDRGTALAQHPITVEEVKVPQAYPFVKCRKLTLSSRTLLIQVLKSWGTRYLSRPARVTMTSIAA